MKSEVPTIMSVGYQQRTIDEIIGELLEAGVNVVVDVRETPWSHRREFSRTPLVHALAGSGIQYVHAWFAGNPKEFRNTARSHQDCLQRYAAHLDEIPDVVMMLADLLRELTSVGLRPCLLCYERHPDDCHRSILLKKWSESYGPAGAIQHLATEGAPRLVS